MTPSTVVNCFSAVIKKKKTEWLKMQGKLVLNTSGKPCSALQLIMLVLLCEALLANIISAFCAIYE